MPQPVNYSDLIRDAGNKMEKLLNLAKTENRDLSDEEQAAFDALNLDVESYKKKLENQQKVSSILAGLNTPASAPAADPANSGTPRVEVVNEKRWKNPGEFLKAIQNAYMPNPRIDNRLILENGFSPSNATGMSVAVGSDGGFMVGAENEQWLMKSVIEQSQVFSRITPIPVGEDKNGTSLPAIAETSRADGSRFGGARAYWASEAGTATATKPTIRNVDIKLEKLLAFCYMTEELLADARALEAFVKKVYGAEMAFKLDDAIIRGDGNGKPLGILNCPALIEVPKESGQAADTIVAQNIIKMWSRLSARNKPNSAWFINQEIVPELSTMTITVGTGGQPVWMPAGGVSGVPYSTLFGRPVIECEQCSAIGDKGDIILADMSDYIGIDKGGLAVDSSIHVQFLYDEMAYRFRYRFNGTPYTKSPLTPYKGSATVGPYVTLAAR